MTVYEQLIDKGFAEKLTEYDLVLAASKWSNKTGYAFELNKVAKQLQEITSEVNFD